MSRFEVKRQEFNMGLKDTKSFKAFLSTVPDTAKYKIDTREDGIFLSTYWIAVIDEPEPVTHDVYTIEMPQSCIYGKSAYEIISGINPYDGIPFMLNATDTIDLSRGFVDILFRKIKDYQAPYVIIKNWVREHIQLLEEVNSNHMVVIRSFENDPAI